MLRGQIFTVLWVRSSILGLIVFCFVALFSYSESLDEVMNTNEAAHLDARQKAMVKDLFSQGVKHKMRVNLVRQMSKTSSSKIQRKSHS